MKPRYAYLGPAGTFTELALKQIVSEDKAEYVPVIDVLSAVAAVRSGVTDYAVVAIENTVEGGVTATLDALAEGETLMITQEVVLPIRFELVARAGVTLESIRRIGAHSHGWAQVRKWANAHIPQAAFIAASSNAAAAEALVAGSASSDVLNVDAAFAPPGTAARLGLTVLVDGVADNPTAATRFVKISRPEQVPAPTGTDKTTLVVQLPTDRSGALLEMLEQFAVRGINLSRIESRPIGDRPGEYFFSIDALGHLHEARMAEALVGLKRTSRQVVFLGSYPSESDLFTGKTKKATPIVAGTADEDFAAARSWVENLAKGQR